MKIIRGFLKITFIAFLAFNLQACSPGFDLTQDEVEMYVGETFNPSDYLLVDDSEIDNIVISNNVNVSSPGTYDVFYELGSTKKTLKVTILGDPIVLLSTNVIIEKNVAFTPKDYINQNSQANDIKIVSNVNSSVPGDYIIVYSLNSIEKILNVVVKELEIELKEIDVSIDLGSEFNPKNYINLNFPNTKNLTINSNVDTSKIGDYKVVYSSGELSKTLDVKVIDASPFLSVTATTIKQGSTFNPLNYLIESDRSNSNIIIDNKVKTDEVGTYLVTYTLGNVQKALSVKVIKSETTATPTPNPDSYKLAVVSLTTPVSPNELATIVVKGRPGKQYSITVYYKSGPSTAAGLEPDVADANGEVSWTWKIGPRTSSGSWKITITGDGKTVSTYITVQ